MKCQRVYKQKKNLNRHMADECGVEPKFACIECGKKFKWKAHLKDHLLKIHKIGRSQLAAHGIGNAIFFLVAPVQLLMNSFIFLVCSEPKVRPIYPFKCGKCARTYKLKRSLVRHENKCGMKDKPRFPCTLCGERLASKCGLREHLKFVHTVARTEFANYGSAGNNGTNYNNSYNNN
jgi:predicted nucleic acid-binding Zn ribbon protein